MSSSSICELMYTPEEFSHSVETPIRVRVLMLDDDEDDVILTRWLLSKIPNYEIEFDWVDNLEQVYAAIREDLHDLYLVDYHLGVDNGIEVLKYASQMHIDAPFILLTGFDDPKIQQAARRAGAKECLNKNGLDSQKFDELLQNTVLCHH